MVGLRKYTIREDVLFLVMLNTRPQNFTVDCDDSIWLCGWLVGCMFFPLGQVETGYLRVAL